MRNRVRSGLLRAALLLLIPFLGSSNREAIADNAVTTPYDSSRIVSIGGSVTEILYAIGEQDKIVAVDTTSQYPTQALQEKPNVGYMRQLSAEGILSLSPTLILAIEGSGPNETIDVLKQAKVPFVTIPDAFTISGVIGKIDIVSRAVGASERSRCLTDQVRRQAAALNAIDERIRQRVRVAFVLSLANDRPIIAGRGTAADGIITIAGATNAFSDLDGYKAVNDEAIVTAKPDVILAMQRGEHALSADTVFSQSALALTPAAAHKRLVSMDGLYLLGFGPRTVSAATDLALDLYPDIASSKQPSNAQYPCIQ